MYKVFITDMNDGMVLLESMADSERKSQKIIGDYFSDKDVNLDGVKMMKIERIFIDDKEFEIKKLEQQLEIANKALKQIAEFNTHDRGLGDDLWMTESCKDIAYDAEQQIKDVDIKLQLQ